MFHMHIYIATVKLRACGNTKCKYIFNVLKCALLCVFVNAVRDYFVSQQLSLTLSRAMPFINPNFLHAAAGRAHINSRCQLVMQKYCAIQLLSHPRVSQTIKFAFASGFFNRGKPNELPKTPNATIYTPWSNIQRVVRQNLCHRTV
jgi:hypothetical protein